MSIGSFFASLALTIESEFVNDILPVAETILKTTVAAEVQALMPIATQAARDALAAVEQNASNTGRLTQVLGATISAAGKHAITVAETTGVAVGLGSIITAALNALNAVLTPAPAPSN